MVADPVLLAVSAASILAGLPGTLWYSGSTWRDNRRGIGALAALWISIGTVLGLTGVLPFGFAVLFPATGLLAGTFVLAVLAERTVRERNRVLAAIAFCVLVPLPLGLAVFGDGGSWLYRGTGALDFAGALPIAIGVGSFCAVAAFATSRLPARPVAATRPLALRGAMLLGACAVGWNVGFELVIDQLTPGIALNTLITPAIAILAAAGIEQVRTGRNTKNGLASGTLAGTFAAIAACAYLETVSAILLGLLVGAVVAAVPKSDSVAARIATPLLVGGSIGMLFLGIFALGPGFVYSGQPVQLGAQALVTVMAVVGSAAVSVLVLLPLRTSRWSVRRPDRV